LGSGLAVLAGGGTVFFLWRQLSQSENIEKQRLVRQHRAIRTTLPLSLSGLCSTMRMMLKELDNAKQVVRREGYTKSFNAPPPPTGHIQELKAVVASTDEPTVIEPIAEIIRQIQTLWARVAMLASKTEQRRRAGLEKEINRWILQ